MDFLMKKTSIAKAFRKGAFFLPSALHNWRKEDAADKIEYIFSLTLTRIRV